MKNFPSLRLMGLIILVILALGLSACERSKSQAPVTTVAPTSPQSSPTQGLNVFETQTPGPVIPPTESSGSESAATPAPAVTATSAVVAPVATATPMAVLPTPSKPPESYTLQKGEFPYCIARRFNINPISLLEYNGLTASSQVDEGDVLKIPQNAPAFPGDRALKSHPTQYTVTAGDTIYTIACDFGDVSPEMIAAANGLSAPYTLTSGSVLQIP